MIDANWVFLLQSAMPHTASNEHIAIFLPHPWSHSGIREHQVS